MWNPFRKREVTREEVRAFQERVDSRLRQFETELLSLSEQARRWMRRAIAAERAARRADRPINRPGPIASLETRSTTMWGARARRAALANAASEMGVNGGDDGVHT